MIHPTLNRIAARKWISLETSITCTHWLMIVNSAPCIEAAGTSARITTLVTDTCKMCWTVLVNKTLWPTVWWSTQHSSETWADWSFIYHSAVRIGSTGWWNTWVCWWCRLRCYGKIIKSGYRSLNHTASTIAQRKQEKLVGLLHRYC